MVTRGISAVRIMPPLVIPKGLIDTALEIFESVVKEIDKEYYKRSLTMVKINNLFFSAHNLNPRESPWMRAPCMYACQDSIQALNPE